MSKIHQFLKNFRSNFKVSQYIVIINGTTKQPKMRFFLFLFLWVFSVQILGAQENSVISGFVLNSQSKESLSNVAISIEGYQQSTLSDSNGNFNLTVPLDGDYILNVALTDYLTKRIPIILENQPLKLGALYLERDITLEQSDNLITLTDSELFDDEVSSNSAGLLQATRDIFLNRAAFDFGQAFFRVRGYDSQNAKVLVNGIPMNKFFDGRPQWNNWGGLNDVTRNQQFAYGLQPSEYNFGGILGTTNIDTRPSGLRSGFRLSASSSNRTYAGRLMATYNSGVKKNGLAYSISSSRRWAKEGYIDGTLYDAFSVFGAIEYRLNEKNSINFTGIWASNRRGRSSAITEEVFDLVGKRYNPYWGKQLGEIRNSKERKIAEPILMLNHFYESETFTINTGIAYQFGTNTRSRLGYYNAPNPDPTYYRYLPSFYINSPIGANFVSANLAKDGFLANPQLNWSNLYTANTNGKAAYVLYDDVADDTQFIANTSASFKVTEAVIVDFGITFKQLRSNNHAIINDLLGADFHEDIDLFSNTLNDVNGIINKREDDIFNYNYNMDASQLEVFAQFRYNRKKWEAFVSGSYSNTNYLR